jgi:hypothetical protein
MYEIVITDSTGSTTLPPLEVPLVITTIEGAVDVEALDKSIYTDFITQKRQVAHTWAYLSETLFNIMKGYYDRQFESPYEYPRITITALGISDMPARMSLNPQSIIDQCGTVEAVTVSFRESNQNFSS